MNEPEDLPGDNTFCFRVKSNGGSDLLRIIVFREAVPLLFSSPYVKCLFTEKRRGLVETELLLKEKQGPFCYSPDQLSQDLGNV